jgi:hypothetical protein
MLFTERRRTELSPPGSSALLDLAEPWTAEIPDILLDDAERRAAHRERQIAAHVAASDAFVAKHGTLADEFGNL